MTPETSPFDPAIVELENRIRHMQSALEMLKQLRQAEGGVTAPAAPLRPAETEVQHDTFFGMTIGEAAKKYLGMMKGTRSTADIAEALERGGLKHSSTNFPNNVRAIIGQREDFLRVPNGDWGLTEWYPGAGRGKKVMKPEKASRIKRATKSKSAKSKGPSMEKRVLEVMRTATNKDWGAAEIAQTLGAKRESVQSIMSNLAKAGKEISKAEKGYHIVAKLAVAV